MNDEALQAILTTEDLHAIRQYLGMVLVSGPARDAAKTIDHLAQITQRVDQELGRRMNAQRSAEDETPPAALGATK